MKTMLKPIDTQYNLKVVFDQIGTPTSALDLAETIVYIKISVIVVSIIIPMKMFVSGMTSQRPYPNIRVKAKEILCRTIVASSFAL